jgi:YggT family protein
VPHPSLAQTIAFIISQILNIYFWIVVISALLTWIEPNPYNPIVRFIYGATEPVFGFVREHLPVFFGGIDFSPMVVIAAIWFVQMWLLPTLGNLLTPGFGYG